jgi:hypothetical protein
MALIVAEDENEDPCSSGPPRSHPGLTMQPSAHRKQFQKKISLHFACLAQLLLRTKDVLIPKEVDVFK